MQLYRNEARSVSINDIGHSVLPCLIDQYLSLHLVPFCAIMLMLLDILRFSRYKDHER